MRRTSGGSSVQVCLWQDRGRLYQKEEGGRGLGARPCSGSFLIVPQSNCHREQRADCRIVDFYLSVSLATSILGSIARSARLQLRSLFPSILFGQKFFDVADRAWLLFYKFLSNRLASFRFVKSLSHLTLFLHATAAMSTQHLHQHFIAQLLEERNKTKRTRNPIRHS